MTCIGFAPDKDNAMVVPFLTNDSESYWSAAEEKSVLKEIASFLSSPAKKVLQNAQYDVFWLWKVYGIPTYHVEDTMLCHHALQPELPKSLGFLGSTYCNLPEWKSMGRAAAKEND